MHVQLFGLKSMMMWMLWFWSVYLANYVHLSTINRTVICTQSLNTVHVIVLNAAHELDTDFFFHRLFCLYVFFACLLLLLLHSLYSPIELQPYNLLRWLKNVRYVFFVAVSVRFFPSFRCVALTVAYTFHPLLFSSFALLSLYSILFERMSIVATPCVAFPILIHVIQWYMHRYWLWH